MCRFFGSEKSQVSCRKANRTARPISRRCRGEDNVDKEVLFGVAGKGCG